MSAHGCWYPLSGLVPILLSNNAAIPRGIRCPAASILPPDDVIIPLFPKFLKARENAVKFAQMKFRQFSPDISLYLFFSYYVTISEEPVYHNIKQTYLL